jgi:succinate dehydrogenase / fumarate reductase flavoprotein subunit
MGGVKVDADSQMTTTPGLFAAGECAAGLHGANRLGGNSLSDLLVFGKRAGEFSAAYAKASTPVDIDQQQLEQIRSWAIAPFSRPSGDNDVNPFTIQYDLQDMMQELVGIARTGKELDEAIGHIVALQKRAARVACGGGNEYNPGWHTAIELKHMLTVAEAIARSASLRKESRGGHFREDYPEKSEDLGKINICIKKDGEGMTTQTTAKTKMRDDLQQIIEEMK